MDPASPGISAIAVYEPPTQIGNDWFGGTITRKFVHHTGIEARAVSADDEVTLGVRAVERLRAEGRCDLRDCAGIVLTSPSFIPRSVANKHLEPTEAQQESLTRAAKRLVHELGIPSCPAVGINWFCSGYARAMSVAKHRLFPRVGLERNQFLLVVTATRISRITNYGCSQTGPLFGDLATATMLSRPDSLKYPVHFDLLYARAESQPARGVFFNFHWQENVVSPDLHGGKSSPSRRLVFSLDGMGIAEVAPKAMASAVDQALKTTGLSPDDVQFVVPHQAGAGIVRLTGMKLEELGVKGELINGLTARTGNVSAGSIPNAIRQLWDRLDGLMACPTAAVGLPGRAEVSRGCILLRGTQHHQATRRAA